MISLQTNVDSLVAQNNLNINSSLQSKTIQQLTSGYRINSSGDDAAGLAVANGYRDNIAELTQGVSNANDGVSQLQIIDGGLSNISTILDRMQTLATESASGTFTGDRSTLNSEYQGLISEITRQASNINLNAGGSFNTNLNVYIGGANTASNAAVSINLGGTSNAVDATSLNLAGTSVIGGGTAFTNPSGSSLNDPNARFLTAGSQAFTINYVDANGVAKTSSALTINSQTGGYSGTQFVQALNQAISNAGITGVTAQIGGSGQLQLSGTNLLSASVTNSGASAAVAGTANSTETLTNGANYQTSAGAFTAFADGTGATTHQSQTLTVTAGGQQYNVILDSNSSDTAHYADTIGHAVTAINNQLQGSGVYAVQNQAGTGIVFQSTSGFTLSQSSFTAGDGTGVTGSLFGGSATTVGTTETVTAPTQDNASTGNASSAIASIQNAIKALGLVQGSVGAGENKLQYAISLAQSQISNFSAAQSQIRDANVATDAANLTKSQVLVQTSIAAMAQANQEPQSVLKLLQG
jgi:flagellin